MYRYFQNTYKFYFKGNVLLQKYNQFFHDDALEMFFRKSPWRYEETRYRFCLFLYVFLVQRPISWTMRWLGCFDFVKRYFAVYSFILWWFSLDVANIRRNEVYFIKTSFCGYFWINFLPSTTQSPSRRVGVWDAFYSRINLTTRFWWMHLRAP